MQSIFFPVIRYYWWRINHKNWDQLWCHPPCLPGCLTLKSHWAARVGRWRTLKLQTRWLFSGVCEVRRCPTTSFFMSTKNGKRKRKEREEILLFLSFHWGWRTKWCGCKILWIAFESTTVCCECWLEIAQIILKTFHIPNSRKKIFQINLWISDYQQKSNLLPYKKTTEVNLPIRWRSHRSAAGSEKEKPTEKRCRIELPISYPWEK